jgi:hypothetical protein
MNLTILLAVVAVTLVIIVLLMLIASKQLKGFSVKVKSESVDRESIKKKFFLIEKMLEASSEMARKVAVAEADRLMEHVLKMYQIPGETQLDRLQEVARSNHDLRDVIITRERVVEKAKAPASRLSESEASEAIRVYKKGFKALGIL